jgi:hypothetical protein
MNLQQRETQMYQAWQVGDDFRQWCKEGRPLRFGQWFMNRHNITGHSEIFYETDYKKAQELILKLTF